jgi:hypothetical protein
LLLMGRQRMLLLLLLLLCHAEVMVLTVVTSCAGPWCDFPWQRLSCCSTV